MVQRNAAGRIYDRLLLRSGRFRRRWSQLTRQSLRSARTTDPTPRLLPPPMARSHPAFVTQQDRGWSAATSVQESAPPPASGCDVNHTSCVPTISDELDRAGIGSSVTVTGGTPHGADWEDDELRCESY